MQRIWKSCNSRHFYGGFGTGRAMYFFKESDLKEAAIAKLGEAGVLIYPCWQSYVNC